MKLSPFVALISVAALAWAQSADDYASQVPTCAEPCLEVALDAGNCDPSDWYCACTADPRKLVGSSVCQDAIVSCSTQDALSWTTLWPKVCLAAAEDQGVQVGHGNQGNQGHEPICTPKKCHLSGGGPPPTTDGKPQSDPPDDAASSLTGGWQSTMLISVAVTLGMFAWF